MIPLVVDNSIISIFFHLTFSNGRDKTQDTFQTTVETDCGELHKISSRGEYEEEKLVR